MALCEIDRILEVQKIGPGVPALGLKLSPGVTEAVTSRVSAIDLS